MLINIGIILRKDTLLHMNNNRLEELLINVFEWAINVSEQLSLDMVKASGITSDELNDIGYEKENFPSLHSIIDK